MFLSTRPIQTDNITIINRFSTSSIKKLKIEIDPITDSKHINESIVPEPIIWPITMKFRCFFWADYIAEG